MDSHRVAVAFSREITRAEAVEVGGEEEAEEEAAGSNGPILSCVLGLCAKGAGKSISPPPPGVFFLLWYCSFITAYHDIHRLGKSLIT